MTRDQYDTIDLTDNDLRKLDNFPTLRRLRTLLVSNNAISKLDVEMANKLPNLEMLILQNNALDAVEALSALAGLKRLRYLSLIDCPVARRPHYRLLVVKMLPQLRALDFRKVTAAEREAAAALAEGKRVAEAVEEDTMPKPKLAKMDRERIKEALQNAKSLEEIKQLERILATGHVPDS